MKNCMQCLEYSQCWKGQVNPHQAQECMDFLHQKGLEQRNAVRKEHARRVAGQEVVKTRIQAGERRLV